MYVQVYNKLYILDISNATCSKFEKSKRFVTDHNILFSFLISNAHNIIPFMLSESYYY